MMTNEVDKHTNNAPNNLTLTLIVYLLIKYFNNICLQLFINTPIKLTGTLVPQQLVEVRNLKINNYDEA